MNTIYQRVHLHIAILCLTANLTDEEKSEAVDMGVYGTSPNGAKLFYISKETQGHMLSVYFYGLSIMMVVGGMISDKMGSKRYPIIIGTAVEAICTLLHPVALNTYPYTFFITRCIQGFAAGVSSPAMYQLFSKWAADDERTELLGIALAGYPAGAATAAPITSTLCLYGYHNWESVFYFFGGFGIFCCILFSILIFDTPDKSPFLSKEEKSYLANHTPPVREKVKTIPWKEILRSPPVYAFLIAHVAQVINWQALSVSLPGFYQDVLLFDLSNNSFMLALPYIALLAVRLTTALLFQPLYRVSKLKMIHFRKLNHIIGTLAPSIAILLLTVFDSEQRYVAVICLTIGLGLSELALTAGYFPTFHDLAPPFAGILIGICNCIALSTTIPSILAVSYTTIQATRNEWNYSFYGQAALLVFSCIIYVVFGSDTLQPWAKEVMAKPQVGHEISTLDVESVKEIQY